MNTTNPILLKQRELEHCFMLMTWLFSVSRLERVDRVGEGDQPLRTLDVEILDKFAIDQDDASADP